MLIDVSDPFVRFRTHDGIAATGTLVSLTRYLVRFSLDDISIHVQLSAVLQDFRISSSGGDHAFDTVVITGVDQNGADLIVCAKLDEHWAEHGFFEFGGRRSVSEICEALISEWDTFHRIDTAFRVPVYEMQARLLEIQRFLKNAEISLKEENRGPIFEFEAIMNNWAFFDRSFHEVFDKFERAAGQVTKEIEPAHQLFVKRQLHPILLFSPFIQRAYRKPLGIAGDYQMVRMILGETFVGASLFSRVLNHWILQQAPAVAHRNRIDYLTNCLGTEIERRVMAKTISVLSFGAGPAVEVERLIKTLSDDRTINFELIDFCAEVVDFLTMEFSKVTKETNRTWRVLPRLLAIQDIRKSTRWPGAPYDVIYCAGLCDYFTESTCRIFLRQLADVLTQDGLLIVTNVHLSNPVRRTMEYLLDWFLHHRGDQELRRMIDTESFREVEIVSDHTGVNLFLRARKKGPPKRSLLPSV